jgi:ComF family protein
MQVMGNFQKFKKEISTISHLLFPQLCLHCDTELVGNEDFICNYCLSELPYTNFENEKESNPMDKLFWGKLPIHASFSLLYFNENSVTQKIIHSLKYQNNPKIGKEYGKKIGQKISGLTKFNDLDLLIPVPIHPGKKFIRGYNQAEMIAYGISEMIKVPVRNNDVVKVKMTESQTKKSMWERWQNSENTFQSKSQFLEYNHVALIDDVLTTGATLERFAESILKQNSKIKISIVTLAITK